MSVKKKIVKRKKAEKDKRIRSFNNLKKDLINQSTDTILEWRNYFKDWFSKNNNEYFTLAIEVCDEILLDRTMEHLEK